LIPNYDPLRDGVDRIRNELLKDYPKLSLVIKLGKRGSMFVDIQTSIYMPSIT